MNKQTEAFWKLFKETGSVQVYMCYKKLYAQESSAALEIKSASYRQTLS